MSESVVVSFAFCSFPVSVVLTFAIISQRLLDIGAIGLAKGVLSCGYQYVWDISISQLTPVHRNVLRAAQVDTSLNCLKACQEGETKERLSKRHFKGVVVMAILLPKVNRNSK